MTFEEFITLARERFPFITERQREQFARLDSLYREWNARINVISRKDIDELYSHHVLHSLCIAAYALESGIWTAQAGNCTVATGAGKGAEAGVRSSESKGAEAGARSSDGEADGTTWGAEVLDLGCGGGFPGIPLAILFPHYHFTLCDSIGKKVTVAREVAVALGLDNVTTVNARAESLTQDFDWVVSRAVTSLDNFMPWVKGRYRRGILYLKGGDLCEEIAAAMAKARLPKGSVCPWLVTNWLKDSYFEQKYVIHIKNFVD